jgi:hypothetical protein
MVDPHLRFNPVNNAVELRRTNRYWAPSTKDYVEAVHGDLLNIDNISC